MESKKENMFSYYLEEFNTNSIYVFISNTSK